MERLVPRRGVSRRSRGERADGRGVLRRRRMITSRDNAKLKLVRALQRKQERDETGLFACEGEDLVAAAAAAGIDPVELLVSGENVLPDLLAAVSTLPHAS